MTLVDAPPGAGDPQGFESSEAPEQLEGLASSGDAYLQAVSATTTQYNSLGVELNDRGFPNAITGPPIEQRNLRQPRPAEVALSMQQVNRMSPEEAAAYGLAINPNHSPYKNTFAYLPSGAIRSKER